MYKDSQCWSFLGRVGSEATSQMQSPNQMCGGTDSRYQNNLLRVYAHDHNATTHIMLLSAWAVTPYLPGSCHSSLGAQELLSILLTSYLCSFVLVLARSRSLRCVLKLEGMKASERKGLRLELGLKLG